MVRSNGGSDITTVPIPAGAPISNYRKVDLEENVAKERSQIDVCLGGLTFILELRAFLSVLEFRLKTLFLRDTGFRSQLELTIGSQANLKGTISVKAFKDTLNHLPERSTCNSKGLRAAKG